MPASRALLKTTVRVSVSTSDRALPTGAQGSPEHAREQDEQNPFRVRSGQDISPSVETAAFSPVFSHRFPIVPTRERNRFLSL